MKEVIGIDLGGTSIKTGLISGSTMLSTEKMGTPETTDESVVSEAIIKTIQKVIQPMTQAIGIGVPGVVDRKAGIVYDLMNIPSWKKVNVKAILEERFNIPVFVDNDANCFAIGEKIYGKGKDYQHFVGLTIGTGMGAGIIQKGNLLDDANCGSGEFGIVPYLDSDYEHYCSGMYFKKIKKDGLKVYKDACNGDSEALGIFEEMGKHIANAVMMVVSTIDPELIVFGGSVSNSFPFFKQSMLEELKEYPYQNSIQNLKIEVSDLQNSAIFGAAALCY